MSVNQLGWVYQFRQARIKDEVNASEVKIGARELPAVTQLFTEPYMVAFLLDNSLGAWWTARRLTEAEFRHAESEDELRTKATLPGMPLTYLRFVKQNDGTWTPAAGTFDGWPKYLEELKTLDPCCGSGHFLVAALRMLVPMRMAMEGLSAREAVDAVLRDNLHGLELDQRCVELAAFALALTAWRYPGAGGYRPLPELHVACSGLSVRAAKEEWRQLAMHRHDLRLALEWMYVAFQDAPVLGSLLNPAKTGAAKIVQWEELSTALEQALTQEQTDEQHEAGVVAQGLAKAAKLLAGHYHLVITNVPYLKQGEQSATLRDFCQKHYSTSKSNLATVFLDRCLQLVVHRGSVCLVLSQNWLSQTSYKKFREKLLQNDTWHLLAWLGAGGVQTPMWDFNVQLIILSRGRSGSGFQPLLHTNKSPEDSSTVVGLDVSASRTAAEKAIGIQSQKLHQFDQKSQLAHPESRVVFGELESGTLLSRYANSVHGQGSFDDPSYVRNFWGMPLLLDGWIFQQTSSQTDEPDSGCSNVFCWENATGRLASMMAAKEDQGYSTGKWKAGQSAWGRPGIAVSSMGRLYVNRYQGGSFDTNVAVVYPLRDTDFPSVWMYCRSDEFIDNVWRIDRETKVTPKTFGKVPFDYDRWTRMAAEEYPNGLPQPYSNDPTQRIFHGHPAQSNTPLQVGLARLLGYRWPAELDSAMELSDDARTWVKKSEVLLAYVDRDAIVCIPAVRAERPAAERLLDILRTAYGSQWSDAILHKLLTDTGCKPGTSLDEWLRDKFFEQHCKRFHDRPFIWHIWDGRKDGFSCLVNYYTLDHQRLETLTYAYLQDWINTQAAAAKEGKPGADLRLAAAQELQGKLKLILAGEPPYDIFVRWKPIHEQRIGWNPDLNDGVRVNIRPFVRASVLRKPPNNKWTKDRGKEPERAQEQFPWFWQNGIFKGDRINDYHLTNAQKRAGREKLKQG